RPRCRLGLEYLCAWPEFVAPTASHIQADFHYYETWRSRDARVPRRRSDRYIFRAERRPWSALRFFPAATGVRGPATRSPPPAAFRQRSHQCYGLAGALFGSAAYAQEGTYYEPGTYPREFTPADAWAIVSNQLTKALSPLEYDHQYTAGRLLVINGGDQAEMRRSMPNAQTSATRLWVASSWTAAIVLSSTHGKRIILKAGGP